jgi:hypothetical protein
MLNRSATDANKSPEPPLSYPGGTPDAERAKKPLLPEPPYEPYEKAPAPRALQAADSISRLRSAVNDRIGIEPNL